MLLAVNAWPRYSVQPNTVLEKPEERVTPVSMDTDPDPASSLSAAADMEGRLPVTDKRAAGTVDDSEMEDGNEEDTRARPLEGMEEPVLDDNYDESLEDQEDRKKVVWIAETCLDTSIECHSVHLRRKDSSPRKQVYATRSGEPMCHDTARKTSAKELKHMQDHNVFEVVWHLVLPTFTVL